MEDRDIVANDANRVVVGASLLQLFKKLAYLFLYVSFERRAERLKVA